MTSRGALGQGHGSNRSGDCLGGWFSAGTKIRERDEPDRFQPPVGHLQDPGCDGRFTSSKACVAVARKILNRHSVREQ